MSRIHPLAIIDSAAQLDSSVTVGAYSIIGAHVYIDAGTSIGPHVVIEGNTIIGRDNTIFQFCSLGTAPQDKKYANEYTQLKIGDRNTIREFVTFNLGTTQDAGITQIGNDNWIMAYVHIAHDCKLGNNIILANNATLAGHVHLDDWVFLGGFTTIHQFCHIGTHAMTAFTSAVSQDIPPFVMAAGNRAIPVGINKEGLKRRGFSSAKIQAIKCAYKTIYRSDLLLDDALLALRNQEKMFPKFSDSISLFRLFIATSSRGIIR